MESPLERWREEKEAAWLYRTVAEAEPAPARKEMFRGLEKAAEEQAGILAGDVAKAGVALPQFTPSGRARLVAALTRRLGPRRCRTLLTAMKVRGLSVYSAASSLGAAQHPVPTSLEEEGRRHAGRGGGGNLRAAVFGVNDGLVSNASLIMGVAGAADDNRIVLMSGVAGLLAGAFSMAAGEWVSVRSQRELFEHQIGQERDELERYPDEEAEELALVYAARGVPRDEARRMAKALIADPEKALDTLAREELGLNPDDLGSAWGAALSSFVAFAAGATVPLLPFLLMTQGPKVAVAAGISAAVLFAVGCALSLFSGRNMLVGGARMLLIGAGAGAATFLIGRALGVSLQ